MDHALTADLGLNPDIYPEIARSHEIIGMVTAEAASITGLRAGTAVVAGGTDISSAAFGCGATESGQAYYSMGTGSNLGIVIPQEREVPEYHILKWPHVIDGLTLYDAPMAFTGASLKWVPGQVRRSRSRHGRAYGTQCIRPRHGTGQPDLGRLGRAALSALLGQRLGATLGSQRLRCLLRRPAFHQSRPFSSGR